MVQDGLEGVDGRLIELDDPLVVVTCCDLQQHFGMLQWKTHMFLKRL